MKKFLLSFFLLSALASALVLNNTSDITVTTSGTPVQVSAASLKCSLLTIQARPGNLGVIYLGGSTVNAASQHGVDLKPNASWSGLPFTTSVIYYDLSDFWIDSTVSGTDGVIWTCVR